MLIDEIISFFFVHISLVNGYIKLATHLAATSLRNGEKLRELTITTSFISFGNIGHNRH